MHGRSLPNHLGCQCIMMHADLLVLTKDSNLLFSHWCVCVCEKGPNPLVLFLAAKHSGTVNVWVGVLCYEDCYQYY